MSRRLVAFLLPALLLVLAPGATRAQDKAEPALP